MGVDIKRVLLGLVLCIVLANFVYAESFGFAEGDFVVGSYNSVYEIQRDIGVQGDDAVSAIKQYISSHQGDADFSNTFKRLNKTEECSFLRSLSQNYSFKFEEGDTPWVSKSFWESYFYIDPCAFSAGKGFLDTAFGWTVDQTNIKIGWMFGVNTFGGESKVFPIFVLLPFKFGNAYLLGDLESKVFAGTWIERNDWILWIVFIILFFAINYLIGLMINGGLEKGRLIDGNRILVFLLGFGIVSILPGFIYVWLFTKNGLFAFLCLIFFTIMINSRMRYLFNSVFDIPTWFRADKHSGISMNLSNYHFTYSPLKTYICLIKNNINIFTRRPISLSSLEWISLMIISVFIFVYPFLASIPVLNVFLSIITLEVLFAPIFWRALLFTFILFFAVQIWPMYSNYTKRQTKYKEAVEEVLAKETAKAMARA